METLLHALDKIVQNNPFLSGLIVGAAGSSLSTWLIWSMKAILHIPEIPTFGTILKSRSRKKTADLIRKNERYVRNKLGGIAANYYIVLVHEKNKFDIDNSYYRKVLKQELTEFINDMSDFFLNFERQPFSVQNQFLDELRMRQVAIQRNK